MPDARKRLPDAVWPPWLAAIVRASQLAAGQTLLVDPEDARTVLTQFAQALPNPANHAERVVLRSLLLEFACRMGADIHAQIHRRHGRAGCAFEAGSLLERFWRVPTEHPKTLFLRWVEEFFTQLARAHPASAAARVARLLRRDYQRTWTAHALGLRLHASPTQLRRQFRRELGMSISDYQRTARVMHGLERVRNEKIEAVAHGVGFKSKKNFYRAVDRLTALTPARFRRLSEAHAAELVDSLRLSLSGRRRAIANQIKHH